MCLWERVRDNSTCNDIASLQWTSRNRLTSVADVIHNWQYVFSTGNRNLNYLKHLN